MQTRRLTLTLPIAILACISLFLGLASDARGQQDSSNDTARTGEFLAYPVSPEDMVLMEFRKAEPHVSESFSAGQYSGIIFNDEKYAKRLEGRKPAWALEDWIFVHSSAIARERAEEIIARFFEVAVEIDVDKAALRKDFRARRKEFVATMESIRKDKSLNKEEKAARLKDERLRRPSLAGDEEVEEIRLRLYELRNDASLPKEEKERLRHETRLNMPKFSAEELRAQIFTNLKDSIAPEEMRHIRFIRLAHRDYFGPRIDSALSNSLVGAIAGIGYFGETSRLAPIYTWPNADFYNRSELTFVLNAQEDDRWFKALVDPDSLLPSDKWFDEWRREGEGLTAEIIARVDVQIAAMARDGGYSSYRVLDNRGNVLSESADIAYTITSPTTIVRTKEVEPAEVPKIPEPTPIPEPTTAPAQEPLPVEEEAVAIPATSPEPTDASSKQEMHKEMEENAAVAESATDRRERLRRELEERMKVTEP